MVDKDITITKKQFEIYEKLRSENNIHPEGVLDGNAIKEIAMNYPFWKFRITGEV